MSDSSASAADRNQADQELTSDDLRRLERVPAGAAALAGSAVLLLLIAWILIYLTVYLPRGMVG